MEHIPIVLLPNANAVVRTDVHLVTVESLDEVHYEHTVAITILNQNGEPLNQAYGRNSSLLKCKLLAGKLFDSSGNLIRKSEKSDIKTITGNDANDFNDGVYQTVSLKHHAYPYTVEYTTKETYNTLIHYPDWDIQTTNHTSVQYSRYTIRHPKDMTFKWKAERFAPTFAAHQINPETTQWEAEIKLVPAQKSETMMRSANRYAFFAPNKLKLKEHVGNVDTWKGLGLLVYKLNEGRDQLSTQMQSRVKQMVEGLKTDQEKIAVLYQYLKTNYRYVSVQIGVGGWQTFDAQYVEQKKYGDCKALSNYMKAMLKTAGIESQLALVRAGRTQETIQLNDTIPYNQFNHMVLYVPSEALWLECTSPDNPPGYMGTFTHRRKALLLTPAGGVLQSMPNYGEKENVQANYTIIKLETPDGMAKISSKQKMTGYYADSWYSAINETDLTKKKDFAAKQLNVIPTQMETLEIVTEKTTQMATVHIELQTKYANKMGNRLNIPLHRLNSFQLSLPIDTNRVADIFYDMGVTCTDTILVTIPAGFTFEAIPANNDFSSAYGTYTKTITKIDDQTLQCIRTMKSLAIDAPKTEYQAIKEWFTKLRTADLDAVVAVQLKRP
jgi:transglutaminase-like putative cysteine protease